MKTKTTKETPSTPAEFLSCTLQSEIDMILHKGILLDADTSDDKTTSLHYLNGYFIEMTFDKKLDRVTEVIPFLRGYRIATPLDSKSEYNNFKTLWLN
jgi:hypothetical protein